MKHVQIMICLLQPHRHFPPPPPHPLLCPKICLVSLSMGLQLELYRAIIYKLFAEEHNIDHSGYVGSKF